MKKKLLFGGIGLAAIAVVVIIIIALSGKNDAYRSVKIIEIGGTANIDRDGKTLAALENMNLRTGDSLETKEESFARMKLDEDKYVYLAENSRISLVAEGTAADSKSIIYINKGEMLTEVQNKLSARSSYDVVTPNTTMAIRGTKTLTTVKEVDMYTDDYEIGEYSSAADAENASEYEGDSLSDPKSEKDEEFTEGLLNIGEPAGFGKNHLKGILTNTFVYEGTVEVTLYHNEAGKCIYEKIILNAGQGIRYGTVMDYTAGTQVVEKYEVYDNTVIWSDKAATENNPEIKEAEYNAEKSAAALPGSEAPTPEAGGDKENEISSSPENTSTPELTEAPEETPTPELTGAPDNTETPSPELTQTPDNTVTPSPELTQTPDSTETPTPELTQTPDNTVTPSPKVTKAPQNTVTPSPEVTKAPDNTITPSPKVTKAPKNTTTPTPKITKSPSNTSTVTPTPKEYRVIINLDGGFLTNISGWTSYGSDAYSSTYVEKQRKELPTATKKGYVFKGWRLTGSTESAVNEISTDKTGNLSYTAVWGSSYTPTDSPAPTPESIPVPTPETTPTPTPETTPEPTPEPTPATYSVTVNTDGGKLDSTSGWTLAGDNLYQSSYTEGKSMQLPTATLDGYDFKGWIKNGSGSPVFTISEKDKGDLSFTASYEKKQLPVYTVSLNLNNSYGSINSSVWTMNQQGIYEAEFEEGETITLPNVNETNSNAHRFRGWRDVTGAQINGSVTVNSDMVINADFFTLLRVTADSNVYLLKGQNNYSGTFDTGGSMILPSPDQYYTGKAALTKWISGKFIFDPGTSYSITELISKGIIAGSESEGYTLNVSPAA